MKITKHIVHDNEVEYIAQLEHETELIPNKILRSLTRSLNDDIIDEDDVIFAVYPFDETEDFINNPNANKYTEEFKAAMKEHMWECEILLQLSDLFPDGKFELFDEPLEWSICIPQSDLDKYIEDYEFSRR